jgi:hypothetical protein
MCQGRSGALAPLVEDWESEEVVAAAGDEGVGGSDLELGCSQRRLPAATLDGIVERAEELGATKPSIDDRWTKVSLHMGKERKAMTSLIMLVFWEIWKECNARVFRPLLYHGYGHCENER